MSDNYKKRFGYEEMLVHVPMCSHNDIKKVLVIKNTTDELKNELDKHQCKDITYSDSLNVEGTFDIILYNDIIKDELEMANIQRCLEPQCGILVSKAPFIYKELDKVKEQLAMVGKDFWIAMPYSFGHNTLLFTSKKYHPQAEIILQVSDLLPDCQYYNTEMQNASFVYPTYITKELTNIAKR